MRLFGLIGYPLTHSFSKKYFTEKFKREKADECAYENFQLADLGELPALLNADPCPEGLNVTIPYKESVLSFLDESHEWVKETGACNCIKITNGRLAGYNTDVTGFERSLLSRLTPEFRKSLILGTGGAAKAVQFVLKRNGIPYTHVSRKHSPNVISYSQLTPALIRENKLIINCTPLGMYPNVEGFPPLDYDAIGAGHLLFDLVYNPEKTVFLKKGEERGAAIQNGYDMLVYQAEESWKIWNDNNHY